MQSLSTQYPVAVQNLQNASNIYSVRKPSDSLIIHVFSMHCAYTHIAQEFLLTTTTHTFLLDCDYQKVTSHKKFQNHCFLYNLFNFKDQDKAMNSDPLLFASPLPEFEILTINVRDIILTNWSPLPSPESLICRSITPTLFVSVSICCELCCTVLIAFRRLSAFVSELPIFSLILFTFMAISAVTFCNSLRSY